MAELSQDTKSLISKYEIWRSYSKPKEGVSTIHVDEVASKVAAFYEQIRTIIDWKEEHLMRRSAIIRKLKRRFIDLEMNNYNTKNIAEAFILELIRGGYFSNDRIEESKIQKVQEIIEKYVFILKGMSSQKGRGLNFYTNLIEIAACEIEETLSPSIKEMALIDFMFSKMKERIKISESYYQRKIIKESDKDIQIYIAVQESLFRLDSPIISYNLLKYKYPFWNSLAGSDLSQMPQNIHKMLQEVENDLNHPLYKKFYAICEKYDTPYLLLGDILSQEGLEKTKIEILEPQLLESKIKGAYLTRLKDLKNKIKRAAIYSTLSIFITKILSLLILEIILAKIFKNQINFLILAADILIPTFLMGFLVVSIRPPSIKNLNLAIIETMKIFYQKEKVETYEIKRQRKRSVAGRFIFWVIYSAGAGVSIGFLWWLFSFFNFPITSIIINLIFIALILFTGTVIRTRAKELTIEEEREGFLELISDMLFLPLTGVGRWLSNKWKKYNAFAAFFNALIDMPFSAFVEFIERWRYFIKEKKEEIR